MVDIINRLGEYGIKSKDVDSWADPKVAKYVYGIDLVKLEDVKDADFVIVSVAHSEFKESGLKKIKYRDYIQ